MSECDNMVDLVFLLDTSGSIYPDDFARVLNFVSGLASRLKMDEGQARVGVAIFGTAPRLIFNLNTYNSVSEVVNAISAIQYSGGITNTAAALEYFLGYIFFLYLNIYTEPNIRLGNKFIIISKTIYTLLL